MTLKLNKNQMENLAKLVAIGNWVANVYQDDDITEYDELEQLIFNTAAEAGCKNLFEKNKEDGSINPTIGFGEIIFSFIKEYNEEMFWEGLVWSLTDRDFSKKYSEQEIGAMSEDTYMLCHSELAKKYEDEFETNGIDRLDIVENCTS
jgi:hypothetical protein